MKPTTIFLDKEFQDANAALLKSLTPGIVQGQGVFETMRVLDRKVLHCELHLGRLTRGLNFLKIRIPYSKNTIKNYLQKILEMNLYKNARIRLMVWAEKEKVRVGIIPQPYPIISSHQYKKGYKAIIASFTRPQTRLSHIKSLDYSIFHKAYQEAQAHHCDEAILLNSKGKVVEGSRTNIFFVKNQILYTPAVHCGCLNGITRQLVIQSARKIGIPYKTVQANADQLFTANEVFLTNALIGIMPLKRLNNKPLNHPKLNAITNNMCKMYNKLTLN